MSVYAGAIQARRDTVKWLSAIAPTAALVAGGVAAAPALIERARTEPNVGCWLSATWPLLVATIIALGALSWLLMEAGAVLSAQPTAFAGLIQQSPGSGALAVLGQAINEGALAPMYLTEGSFRNDLALATAADAATLAPLQARLSPAIESLSEWSIQQQIQRPFGRFIVAFVASVGALIGTAVASGVVQRADVFPVPTLVDVSVNEPGAKSLLAATGCSTPATATFHAVGGTWEEPVLQVDGEGCDFGAEWRPKPAEIEVRPASE